MSLKYPAVIDLAQELTNGFAARFIRYKAARLIGRAGIRPSDREDLEQELKLHLIQRFPKFDPQVAHWNAFVVTVISRHILTLLVQRRRCKRQSAPTFVSLDEFATDTGDVDDDPDTAGAKGLIAPSVVDDSAQRDLVLDVQEALARMPGGSRNLCRRLVSDSPAEVARQLGVPRTTLYGRIIALRQQFE